MTRRRIRPIRRSLTPLAALLAGAAGGSDACTTFATVRSARVHPGASAAVHVSGSTRPGAETGWFWSYDQDCAEGCDHPVVGGDVGVTYGWTPAGRRPFALGLGLAGVHPYVDGYAQLDDGARPYGVGARLGLPVGGWREHQLYGRYDVPLARRARVLLNPALFLHEGASPNGQNRGTFVAFVQGAGLLLEGNGVSLTPSVALVLGRASRSSYGSRRIPVGAAFATASLGITLHPRAAR
jgi:hypothetical protein